MEQQSQSRRLGMSLFAMLASMEASSVFEVSTSAASARSPSTKPTESASGHPYAHPDGCSDVPRFGELCPPPSGSRPTTLCPSVAPRCQWSLTRRPMYSREF
jgi:hypothetical protein